MELNDRFPPLPWLSTRHRIAPGAPGQHGDRRRALSITSLGELPPEKTNQQADCLCCVCGVGVAASWGVEKLLLKTGTNTNGQNKAEDLKWRDHV